MFTIEKGIPIPINSRNIGMADTLRAMEIGDSFLCPMYMEKGIHTSFKKADPTKKFQTRRENGMLRVWRTG